MDQASSASRWVLIANSTALTCWPIESGLSKGKTFPRARQPRARASVSTMRKSGSTNPGAFGLGAIRLLADEVFRVQPLGCRLRKLKLELYPPGTKSVLDTVYLDFGIQGGGPEPEQPRRLGLIAFSLFECKLYQRSFKSLHLVIEVNSLREVNALQLC